MESHAQQLPQSGDRAGERAPWLGGAVPRTPANDGTSHPGGEQVLEGPTEEGAVLGSQEAPKETRNIFSVPYAIPR